MGHGAGLGANWVHEAQASSAVFESKPADTSGARRRLIDEGVIINCNIAACSQGRSSGRGCARIRQGSEIYRYILPANGDACGYGICTDTRFGNAGPHAGSSVHGKASGR